MIDDIAGYRFEDLVDAGILKSRTDLARKQQESGFPLPVKLGKRGRGFQRGEVQQWLSKRIAERPKAKHQAASAADEHHRYEARAPERANLDRDPEDFYIDRIGVANGIAEEPFEGGVYDPACGDGALSTVA